MYQQWRNRNKKFPQPGYIFIDALFWFDESSEGTLRIPPAVEAARKITTGKVATGPDQLEQSRVLNCAD
jgi:hypothetical protein